MAVLRRRSLNIEKVSISLQVLLLPPDTFIVLRHSLQQGSLPIGRTGFPQYSQCFCQNSETDRWAFKAPRWRLAAGRVVPHSSVRHIRDSPDREPVKA
jgi:hypothetical protein